MTNQNRRLTTKQAADDMADRVVDYQEESPLMKTKKCKVGCIEGKLKLEWKLNLAPELNSRLRLKLNE